MRWSIFTYTSYSVPAAFCSFTLSESTCETQSYQTFSLSFFMPWDGKVWSKSLFKACQFTCQASWKCRPAVIFCVGSRHANTAAIFQSSKPFFVKIILQYRANPATNLINIKLIYNSKNSIIVNSPFTALNRLKSNLKDCVGN